MAKYILVYTILDSPDEGGGIFTEEFGMDEKRMHETVEELIIINRDCIVIIYAGFLQTEFKYDIIEYAIRVEPKRVS